MKSGIISLADLTFTTAGDYAGSWITGCEGALALTLQLRFGYVSGLGDARVYLQTSLDSGTTEVDLCCALFNTAAEVVMLNFSGLTPSLFNANSPPSPLIPTDGALTDNSAIDGILGDRFRIKAVTTGTYSGQTLLSARMILR